jgi:hypothetical protein
VLNKKPPQGWPQALKERWQMYVFSDTPELTLSVLFVCVFLMLAFNAHQQPCIDISLSGVLANNVRTAVFSACFVTCFFALVSLLTPNPDSLTTDWDILITCVWAVLCGLFSALSFFLNKRRALRRREGRRSTVETDADRYLALQELRDTGGIGKSTSQGGLLQLSGLLFHIFDDSSETDQQSVMKLIDQHSIDVWPFLHLAHQLDTRYDEQLRHNLVTAERKDLRQETTDEISDWVKPLCEGGQGGQVDMAGKLSRECRSLIVFACLRSPAWHCSTLDLSDNSLGPKLGGILASSLSVNKTVTKVRILLLV